MSIQPVGDPWIDTVEMVETNLTAIDAIRGDNEVAHYAEDRLHQGVLNAIALGKNKDAPADLAAAALRSCDIEFDRWYA